MNTGSTGVYLLCQIGVRLCAVPLAHVSETMRPLPIEPLADMPPFVMGLAIIRARPVPVLDAGRLVGAPCLSPSRFVTIRTGERVSALAVDAVLGVRVLPPGSIAAAPRLLGEANAELVTAMGALDGELLLVLEAARLVPESVWGGVEAARAYA
jgi:purine-binding chemotaxis protein CheW